jgi:hypothetical protein
MTPQPSCSARHGSCEQHRAASGRPFTEPIVSQLCCQFRAAGVLRDEQGLSRNKDEVLRDEDKIPSEY